MVSVQQFLQGVQDNAFRIHFYLLGHSGDDGKSDCIGLIIGALALCGFEWPGVHGSNWAARNAMATFGPINSASECFPGEIVYKAKEPGDAGYDLPSSYRNSPDQRDYYHVGVVTSVDPFCITHCTGVDGGIKRDNALGKWRWGGKLKYVDYNEAEEKPMVYKATVYAENGYPVKMRKLPSAQSSIILQVPLGATVEVTGEVDAVWAAIDYNGIQGYMMRKFLRKNDSEPISGTAVAVNRADLETVKTALETALNVIDKLLMVG